MSDDLFDDAAPDEDPVEIENAAVRYLSRRDYSSGELRDKLKKKGFASHAVDQVLAALVERGWIDDERFARAQSEILVRKGWGPLQISRKLQHHGVPRDLADHTLEALAEETSWPEACRERLERKFGPAADLSQEEKEKAYRHLKYRGFAGATIRRVLFD